MVQAVDESRYGRQRSCRMW